MQSDVYPGILGVRKNQNLTPEEQQIEQRFVEQLETDLKGWFAEYERRFGRTLDTDSARELCEEWTRSRESRARLASAIHFPASQFVAALYRHWLQQKAKPGRDTILFMSGGGGSGKTVAIREKFPKLLQQAHLAYDTTLSNQEHAQDKIALALAAAESIGIKGGVQVLYVYRPFAAAVKGVIKRAIEEEGRTVPLDVLANDHVKAPQTALHLLREYPLTSGFDVHAIDNSGDHIDKAVVAENTLEFLEQVAYNKVESLRQVAQKVLNDEIRNRREKGEKDIPEYIIESLLRPYIRQ